ncbi:DNA repair and recombination protein RAD26 [Pyrenophora tritici-repentis]|nr:DNA repair and recombination protein RAD26 [Pyrenophora tritici-repentis Pt-1C-BFP]KAF7573006.1 HepA, Superfamily II DNA-RNA helicase, SNF2 family [Pyrenophora tritici-repentis]EDU43558.1 DNA repair and recombination protein RAD26 [Pyrenophora tritici-repentis Pt-1C-BFP]KAG9381374.1 DNA repair and recombination protein RAD26 [Pyrenophora tritici-repentis]KAI1528414.1 HepA Superfamily II DNA RNA helicase SNF2 family [Pyrenophora tritici-repentis]KAI1529475.1 HepA Superfamily II DNA RNA helic
MKPFRPLTLTRHHTGNGEPANKKRRISSNALSSGSRQPLNTLNNPAPAQFLPPGLEGNYYKVLWRKYTTKKNKTWDGDGVLAVVGGHATLTDSDTGKELGKGACTRPLLPGSTLSLGGKELEVEGSIDKADYLAGRMFLGTAVPAPIEQSKRVEPGYKPLSSAKSKANRKSIAADDGENVPEYKPSAQRNQLFKAPLLSNTVIPQRNPSIPQPRHDPHAPNALIMKRPDSCPKGKQIVDVVVDPVLSKHLREHQRDGVQFLYECVMGMRCEGEGAIMADEMGLGKTLQTIALLWTLMKQNPIHGASPVIKKALIVCPAGLVDNWKREFKKWLGNERIGVYVLDAKNKKIANFTMGKSYNILIVGYEMLRVYQEELKRGSGVDIVIADEGHRLKTANNKAMLAIQSLNTERRIILSGTPLQNDLGEFYTAIDFVNPGLLGQRAAFKRTFEAPIIRSRQPDASESDLEKGEARWKELVSLTSQFMIRRTAEVLSKYLPPKTEHIVFCRPTKGQAEAYRAVLDSPTFRLAMGSSDIALQLINVLKKICNSPSLLKSSKDNDDTPSEMLQSILPLIPNNILNSSASSAKLRLLDSLVHRIYTTTEEKIVIVSNYTTTLDMIERLLVSLSYTYLRLDGSTPASKRQALVEKFNKTPKTTSFAFLLSAKSGGVGLNLIGASRIVLFDIDWNPATDLQAMARIHRDGQKLPCKVYRFLVQGGLDEKIYQRQIMKMGLANAVVDNKASASSFSQEELRDLFRLDERDGCQTHDISGCTCGGQGTAEVKVDAEELVSDDEDDIEDSEEDLYPTLTKASQVNMEEQEAKIRARRAAKLPKLRMLMEYRHIDTKILKETTKKEGDENVDDIVDNMAVVIDDDVFLEVLREPECNVGFVLTKSTS